MESGVVLDIVMSEEVGVRSSGANASAALRRLIDCCGRLRRDMVTLAWDAGRGKGAMLHDASQSQDLTPACHSEEPRSGSRGICSVAGVVLLG